MFEFGFNPNTVDGMTIDDVMDWQNMAREWEDYKRKAADRGR